MVDQMIKIFEEFTTQKEFRDHVSNYLNDPYGEEKWEDDFIDEEHEKKCDIFRRYRDKIFLNKFTDHDMNGFIEILKWLKNYSDFNRMCVKSELLQLNKLKKFKIDNILKELDF